MRTAQICPVGFLSSPSSAAAAAFTSSFSIDALERLKFCFLLYITNIFHLAWNNGEFISIIIFQVSFIFKDRGTFFKLYNLPD